MANSACSVLLSSQELHHHPLCWLVQRHALHTTRHNAEPCQSYPGEQKHHTESYPIRANSVVDVEIDTKVSRHKTNGQEKDRGLRDEQRYSGQSFDVSGLFDSDKLKVLHRRQRKKA